MTTKQKQDKIAKAVQDVEHRLFEFERDKKFAEDALATAAECIEYKKDAVKRAAKCIKHEFQSLALLRAAYHRLNKLQGNIQVQDEHLKGVQALLN